MSGRYRGVLKVAGSSLRGWLVDTAKPARRVRFNLVIDDEFRGTFVANRKRRSLFRREGPEEDTYGFAIPLRKPWISGAIQTIRLEDPGDAELDVTLKAKLGPRANTHFADNVVGGQISLGDRGAPPARDGDDDHDHPGRPGEAARAMLKQIAQLNDAELVHLMLGVERDILLARMHRHDKAGDWQGMQAFRRLLLGGPREQLLLQFGRSAMSAHNHAMAARVGVAAAALHPQSFEAGLLAGAAKSLQGEYEEALRYLRVADRLEKDTVRAKREMVVALAKQLRGEISAERREDIRGEHLALLRALSVSGDAIVQAKYRVQYATALFAAGRYEETIAAADAVLAAVPNDTRALMVKARALVARNAIADAHLLYERILDIEPGHRGARTALRILAALVEDETLEHPAAHAGVVHVQRVPVAPDEGAARGSFDAPLARRLAAIPQSWICTTAPDLDDDAALAQLAAAGSHRERRVGCLDVALPDGRRFEFWHRNALMGLAESGLIDALDDAAALARWKPYYRQHPSRPARGIAALMSRHGASRYGGGEHFLEQAAEHHARQGFDPVLVGTRNDLRGQDGHLNGRRSTYIGDAPADLRRFFLENDVALVHAISGMGFAVAEALNFTNIPFLYGVHFWNEMLGDPHHARHFDDVTGSPLFRREFHLILTRATAIYANSEYTQRLIEEGFGVRCPVVLPVPR